MYLGTRDDKKAREVRREDAKPVAKPAVPARSGFQKHHRVRTEAPGREKSGSGLVSSGNESRSLNALVTRLNELEDARKDGDLDLPNGDRLRVTNLAKVFWPELGITKGELLRYYVQVSPYLLPAVDDRPLVMKRFPNGVSKQAFYQQRHPEQTPPGVRREVLPEHIEPIDEEGPRDRLIGGSLTTLLYMTQLAAISQDPWFLRVADPLHADYVAIDLDPGEGAGFDRVRDVARWVKADELDRLDVPACRRRPDRAACTSTFRCLLAPRTRRASCSVISSRRSWSRNIRRSPRSSGWSRSGRAARYTWTTCRTFWARRSRPRIRRVRVTMQASPRRSIGARSRPASIRATSRSARR